MKKFYVLAAAAAIAMSAAAQDKLYVVGQWGGENHFNGADQKVFEKTGDKFVFQIEALSAFKISTVSLAQPVKKLKVYPLQLTIGTTLTQTHTVATTASRLMW